VPIVIYCHLCAAKLPVPSIQLMCCPRCGAPAADVVSGQEMEVTAMEIEESDTRECESVLSSEV
jgi:Zn finger protein HypA/HybF involved in hydrogenase expression